jgi:hypothetical protein
VAREDEPSLRLALQIDLQLRRLRASRSGATAHADLMAGLSTTDSYSRPMKRTLFVAITLLVALAGCASVPDPEPMITPSATSTPDLTPPSLGAAAVSGTFVSQGAPTEGTVSISQTSDKEFEIKLTDFSTGAGDDLRIWLSPGALEKDAGGHFSVAGERQYELPGKIDATQTDQVFVFPLTSFPQETVRSFTVYDYANRTAFGSATLE